MGLFGMTVSYILFSVLHLFLLVLALTVAGLYGVDLQRAAEEDKDIDSKWVFAEVVAGLSAITTLLYFVPFVLRFMAVFIWDAVLFVLWISLFGVFGKMFINEDAEGDDAVQRMKNAVWVDLVSALLWLFASVATFIYWFSHRERRSRFTGRAKV